MEDNTNVTNFVLVDSGILPEVYRKVLAAKALIASGKASSASAAAKMAGISRSAYYKYKDAVYEYHRDEGVNTITLLANLVDSPGILSTVMNALYQDGANIVSISQNIPVNNVASVSITARIDNLKTPVDDLVDRLNRLEGVRMLERIK